MQLKTKVPAKEIQQWALIKALFSNEPSTVKIPTEADYDQCIDLLKTLKASMKATKAVKESLTKPLNAAKSAVIREFKDGFEDWAAEKEKALKCTVQQYLDIREAADRKERLASAKAAITERKDLEGDLEKAIEAGDDDEAEALLDKIGAIQIAGDEKVIDAKGVSQSGRWAGEVTDLTKLIKAVAAGKVSAKYVTVNQAEINTAAQEQRESLNIPGVTAVFNKTVSIRT